MSLMGRTVDVNANAAVFVTVNPAGKGYGGRQKLPANVKQLFRPVAMSVPDNELIAEVLLFAEGFCDARALGRRLVSVYMLCRQLLSEQIHCDWGLRALKTVLGLAGQQLQRAPSAPDVAEEVRCLPLRGGGCRRHAARRPRLSCGRCGQTH